MLLSAALLGCRDGSKSPPKPQPVEVGVVTLATEPVTVSAELTGRLTATATSEVRPQVAGIIRARLFEEGATVHAGQALYQIDPRLYAASRDEAAAQLANAQAALVTARAKVARYRRLTEADAISRQEVDDAIAAAGQAQATVQQARATLRTAQVNLEFTKVYAPITGRIGRSLFTQGALVAAGQDGALATIQKLDPIFLDIQQSSQALLNLRESLAQGDVLPASTTVRLILENGKAYPLSGTLEFGEVAVDPESGTVTLRARFSNPKGVLLPGMFARVDVPQSVVRNGILAPQQGIGRDAKGNATALVVNKDHKVEQRSLTASKAIGDRWLVTAGLRAGEKLIVQGTDKAKPGATVRPRVRTH